VAETDQIIGLNSRIKKASKSSYESKYLPKNMTLPTETSTSLTGESHATHGKKGETSAQEDQTREEPNAPGNNKKRRGGKWRNQKLDYYLGQIDKTTNLIYEFIEGGKKWLALV